MPGTAVGNTFRSALCISSVLCCTFYFSVVESTVKIESYGSQQPHWPPIPTLSSHHRVLSLLETVWKHCSRQKAAFPQHTAGFWGLHLCLCCSLCLDLALPFPHNRFYPARESVQWSRASWNPSFCSSKPCSASRGPWSTGALSPFLHSPLMVSR